MGRLDHSSLWQMTLMRVREFAREPEAVFWTFLFPVIMAVALGIAFRDRPPAPVRVAVSEAVTDAPELIRALNEAEALDAVVLADDAAARELARGNIVLVIRPGTGGTLEYRYDRAREESRVARLAVDNAVQRGAGRRDPVGTSDVLVQERGARYIDFLIPGLIGLNLLSTGLWGVGYTVVRMRSADLLKRFMATPMRRGEFLISFFLGRLAFLVAELALVLGFAWIAFDVPVRGSLLALLFISVLGAFSFTGLGLLVASRAKTTEGVTGIMNLAAVPMWILSGVFFSSENFPTVMQPFIEALPLTALLDAFRAVMLDGAALAATTGSLLIVVGWGVASFAAALPIFRWR